MNKFVFGREIDQSIIDLKLFFWSLPKLHHDTGPKNWCSLGNLMQFGVMQFGWDYCKVKFSEGFTVILNFYSRLNSIIGRNSLIGLWEIFFFLAQRFFAQNLKSTKAVKVLIMGINILGRRDRTVKKMPKNDPESQMVLKNHPQAYE